MSRMEELPGDQPVGPYNPRERNQTRPGDDVFAIWRDGHPEVPGSPYSYLISHMLNLTSKSNLRVALSTAYGARSLPTPELQPLTLVDAFLGGQQLIEAAERQNTELFCIKDTGLRLGALSGIQRGLMQGYVTLQNEAIELARQGSDEVPPTFDTLIPHTGGLYIPLGRISLDATGEVVGLDIAMRELGLRAAAEQ